LAMFSRMVLLALQVSTLLLALWTQKWAIDKHFFALNLVSWTELLTLFLSDSRLKFWHSDRWWRTLVLY
jgi:hypothetical protein